MKQYLREFVHNVIVHPLMMFIPTKLGNIIHDRNADWAFKDRCDELYFEGRKENNDHA